MEKIFVKPKEGLVLRDDKTKMIVPKAGMKVDKSSYWVRRLQCGDAQLVESAEKKENKKHEKKGDK